MNAATHPAADQRVLRDAILDPAAPVPPGLTDGAGRPAGRRFAVYRNNVAASLIEALEQAFPVVRRLVGDAFFRAMAGAFVRHNPPRSPLVMLYGDAFPGFLAGFPPVAHLPYLPDVARLEQARRESYHAADATPVHPGRLAPDVVAGACLVFAPPVRLVRSRFPVHSIWIANTAGGPRPRSGPEDVLVTRPGLDPAITRLDAGAAVLERLLAGATVAEAAEAESPAALSTLFAALLSGHAITAIEGVAP
jgi:hypothetical protein